MNNGLSPSEIEQLAYKEQTKTINPQEKLMLNLWYDNHDDTRFIHTDVAQKVKGRIWHNIKTATKIRNKRHQHWAKLISAACLAFIMGIALYFFLNKTPDAGISFTGNLRDLSPGKNHAILTMENGEKVDLLAAGAVEVVMRSSREIDEIEAGRIVYKTAKITPAGFNTIETPAGGQYQVDLPDGSKVWLNAKSTLKFPLNLAADKQRIVELTGEGYFEIKKDLLHPFIVKSTTQTIKVLGTHFNVNTYANEPAVLTTLIEGSIELDNLNKKIKLSPGEQAANNQHFIQIRKHTGLSAIAWKDGYFEFNNDNLETVMRQIARWYDLTVVYGGKIPDKKFTGKIHRILKLSGALKILTYFEVSFEVRDKTIYIK